MNIKQIVHFCPYVRFNNTNKPSFRGGFNSNQDTFERTNKEDSILIDSLNNKEYEKFINFYKNQKIDINSSLRLTFFDDDELKKAQELINLGFDAELSCNLIEFDSSNIDCAKRLFEAGVEAQYITELLNYKDNIDNIIKLFNSNVSCQNIIKDCEILSDSEVDKICELTKRGVEYDIAHKIAIYNEKDYLKAKELLSLGVDFRVYGTTTFSSEYYNSVVEYRNQNKTQLGEFFQEKDYDKKIKEKIKGKYSLQLEDIFLKDKIPYNLLYDLIKTGLSKEDFLSSIEKFSKSTFKTTMNTPNQYLSDIDIKYSTKIEGKYPKLNNKELLTQQKRLIEFYKKNLAMILRALKYIDTDTINQMLDKRTELFESQLSNLDSLNSENYELLSSLIKCKTPSNKDLSAKDKIQLAQIVVIIQESKIDKKLLIESLNKGVVDILELKNCLADNIIKRSNVTKELLSENKKFNEEFSYLLLMNRKDMSFKKNLNRIVDQLRLMDEKTFNNALNKYLDKWFSNPKQSAVKKQELANYLKDLDNLENKEIIDKIYSLIEQSYEDKTDSENNEKILFECVKQTLLNNFDNYIEDKSNPFGAANEKTRIAYKKYNLNFENWLNPCLELNFSIKDKNYKLKTWDRDPGEDLFLGNKTTCCSAIGSGTNGEAMPIFLFNQAFSVVSLYDESDNVIGLSRVFWTIIDNKPALILDNIELNSTYFKQAKKEDLTIIRDKFFEYMKEYANKVSIGQNPEIYFCAGDLNVPKLDLETTYKKAQFLGATHPLNVYINSADYDWINTNELDKEKLELFKV